MQWGDHVQDVDDLGLSTSKTFFQRSLGKHWPDFPPCGIT